MASVVVTDIEGTTSSIAFVHDVLFPYASAAMADFVAGHGHEPEVRSLLDAVVAERSEETTDRAVPDDAAVVEVLRTWIAEDRKHPALKALQGIIWRAGYEDGSFRAPVYPDAVAALTRWHRVGLGLYVYSSGSVAAQQLFFGYSDAGDLRPLFSGWFDTAIGAKQDPASYGAIAAEITAEGGLEVSEIVFLSDVVAELDAARAAGLETILVDRSADYPEPRLGGAANGHARVTSFDEITLAGTIAR